MFRRFISFLFIITLAAEHGSDAQDGGISIHLLNSCLSTVWPAWITHPGDNTIWNGTELASNTSFSLIVPRSWSGIFWARTNCSWSPVANTSKFVCDTGDCGSGAIPCSKRGNPPATLAYLNLPNRYSVSLLEGYNLGILISPKNSSCAPAGCKPGGGLNSMCPKALAVVDKVSGRAIACKSPCLAFGEDQYCCRGKYTCPDKCTPSNDVKFFNSVCSRATTYPCEQASSYSCLSPSDFTVTFCPK